MDPLRVSHLNVIVRGAATVTAGPNARSRHLEVRAVMRNLPVVELDVGRTTPGTEPLGGLLEKERRRRKRCLLGS